MSAQETARPKHCFQNSPLSNVYLRIKPKSQAENDENYTVLNSTTLLVKRGDSSVERKFIFKKIFEPQTSQTDVFDQCTRQRVIDLISGHSSSIVAYGSSNSGKTYTLYGTPEWPGIIPRSIEFIFSAVNCTLLPWYKITDDNQVVSLNDDEKYEEIQNKLKLINPDVIEKEEYVQARLSLDNSVQELVDVEERETCGGDGIFSAWLSMAEIYNDNVYDLLAVDPQERRPLKMSTRKDGSTYVKGLNFVNVSTGLEACQLLFLAQSRMTVAANGNNGTSSRSHTLFVIRLLKYQKRDTANEVEVSTLTFCDVAGSGRSKSAKEDGVASTESKSIKYSLLVLGRCLKSIKDSYSNGDQAVGPFRESKLTRVLQKALTGKENVSFVITIDTADQFFSETMGILNTSVIVRKIESESRDSRRGQMSELTPRSLKAYLIPIIGETPRKTVSFEEYESLRRRKNELLEELEDLKKSRADCLKNNKRLQKENDKLTEALDSLKCDRLNRELEIRDELFSQYSAVVEEVEASWKKRVQDIENEGKELLKKSVNQAELFYRERIDSIMRSKKRKRRDSGDNEESLYFYDELETENALVTSKVVLLKETVKNLKRENELLSGDKIRSGVELSVLKEELQDLRDCFRKQFPEVTKEDQLEKIYSGSLVKDLKLVLSGKKEKIETLEKDLAESKENYARLKAEASKKEQESQVLIKILENQLDKERTLTGSLKCQLQLLKESKASCNRCRGFSSSSVSDFFCSEDVSTPELATQAHVDTKLDRYFNYESAKTSRKMSPDDSEADMVFRFSDGSAKEDSGIESSLKSRGSTGVSDSPAHIVKEQCTQTMEDDVGMIEQRMEQLKIDYGKLEAQYSEEKACVLELSQQLDTIKAVVEVASAIHGASEAEEPRLTVGSKESREIPIPAIPRELQAWAERVAKFSAKIKDLKKELSEKCLEMEGNNEKLKNMQQYTINEYENVAAEYREELRKTQWNCKNNLEILERNVEDISKMAEKLEQSLKEISTDCLMFSKLFGQLYQQNEEKQERIDRLNERLVQKDKRLCSLKRRKELMMKKFNHLIKQLRNELEKKKEKLLGLEKLFANNSTKGYPKFVNRKLGKAKIYHLSRNLKNKSPFWLPHSNQRVHDVKCLSFTSRWSMSSQRCERCSQSQILEQKEMLDDSSTCRSEESSSTEGSSGLNNSNADARQTQSDASDCSEVYCKCGIGFRDPGRHRRMSGWMKVRRMNARTELSCQADKKRDCVNTSDSETDVAEWCFVGLNDYAAI